MIERQAAGENRLNGQVAIVTGGTGGIGKATCMALVKEGINLVIVDIDKVRIDELIVELDEKVNDSATLEAPLGLALNVRKEQDMNEMVQQTIDRFGRIDILVHCAAILRGKGSGPKFLHQIATEEWDEVIETNLKGTFLCNRAVLNKMIQQKKGLIINFSSTSGIKGRAFDSVYCASKFGVVGLSEALAEEVRQYGIKVQLVMPDAVDTPIWEQNGPIRAPKDSLQPDSISNLVRYLVSLPDDTILGNLAIYPFHGRRRKKEKV